jgi:hypothetical protein
MDDCIIPLKLEVLAQTTSLTPPHFILSIGVFVVDIDTGRPVTNIHQNHVVWQTKIKRF